MDPSEYRKIALRPRALSARQLLLQARQFETPQQAAYTVEASAERWRGTQHVTFLKSYADDMNAKRKGNMTVPNTSLNALGDHMSVAPLYAVMEEAAALIKHGATAMEPQPLLRTDLPAPSGILMFQYAFPTTDLHGVDIPVVAMQWLPAVGREDGSGSASTQFVDEATGVAVAWYTTLDDLPHARRLAPVLPPLSLVHMAYLPYGSTLGLLPGATEDQVAPWKFLFATWAFVQQQVVYSEVSLQPRSIRRRAEREGRRSPGPLQVVMLRRATAAAVQKSDTPNHVDWHCRWIVTGHWRRLWNAKVAAERQIWILPYVKGPADKPLVGRKKVFNVAR